MATQVTDIVEIELIDGTQLTLRPLKISLLRDFMKQFEKIGDEKISEDNIKSMDLLLDCAVIAMRQYNPDLADKVKLEEIIDLPTIYKVIEVAAGIKLNDPNALAAALAGTN
jgi:inhibitor of KinA sporulation pathway (predicted exonuclease)